LAALRRLDLLDTAAEQAFDDVVVLASLLCETPMASVTLIDRHRQWFKARIGLASSETPREESFCAHAILEPAEVLVVHDATRDARFAENPSVLGDPNIRFYAGACLVTVEGDALGTLCAIDSRPRSLSGRQIEGLQSLARIVMKLIELRRTSAQLAEVTGLLHEQSETDALTGLPNRRAFEKWLAIEILHSQRHGDPLSLLLLDLDHFKGLNDTFGHGAGDEALRAVAAVLRGNARHTDVASRYGGEEFVVLLRHTDRAGAQTLAERFRLGIEGLPAVPRTLTASIGAATWAPGVSGAQLLAAADRALYRAKAAGRNQICDESELAGS
jgi:diguanylate cyclase (GGDEF)-like protein